MNSFLQQVFEHAEQKTKSDWNETLFLFPNNRSAYYFKEILKESLQPGTILPKLDTLERFIFSHAESERINPVIALANLYDTYKEKYPDTTLRQFLSVGKQMITDFDELEREMVDIAKFFRDLKALKSMNVFMEEDEMKVFKYKYFWETFEACYKSLNNYCKENNCGYDGLLYKDVANRITEIKTNFNYIFFVGFTQLTKAETEIVKYLLSTSNGDYLIDADKYYFDGANNIAAIPYKKAIKSLGIRNPLFITSNITETKKEIHIYPCNGKTQQIQAVFDELKQQQIPFETQHQTALVLPDAALLERILDFLPNEFSQANISMGLPAKDSLAVRFIGKIRELLDGVKDFNGELHLYRKLLTQIAEFPFISNNYEVRQQMSRLENLVYVNVKYLDKYFTGNELFTDLISKHTALKSFSNALIVFLESVAIREIDSTQKNVLYIIRDAAIELNKHILSLSNVSASDYLEFLLEQVNAVALPFDVDPTKGLQIMGIMESRNLDYEQVFIFSMNEGVFPKTGKSNSYIPHELRMVYLSHPIEKDAISTYLFYRLLQRASKIHLLYDTNQDAFAGGEPSRFILQTKIQLASLPNVSITEYDIKTELNIADKDELTEVTKEEIILQKLHDYLSKSGLSPSAINTYNTCSLKFYYNYVLGLKTEDEPEESIESALIGSAVHHVLETFFKPYINKEISEQTIVAMQDKSKIESLLKEYFATQFDIKLLTGKNFLSYTACVKLVIMFLRNQIDEIKEQGNVKVIALEDKLEFSKSISGVEVKFKGLADRVDEVSKITRIIDYKTGKSDKISVKAIDYETLIEKNGSKKFQLLMYAWLYKNMCGSKHPLSSGIYWLKKNEDQFESLSIGKEVIISEEHLIEFEQVLTTVVAEILDKETPFIMTEDKKVCGYCDYINICNRN
jgi:ATP-dependent helicase/nuclease subunit B